MWNLFFFCFPGNVGDPNAVDAVMIENRQLRLDRDLLMQKLIRSKGALKETLDRLTTSNQYKKDQLSPLPPRRMLSSSSVLSSVGSSSSRSKVTQDLIEFSRTHQQAQPQQHHKAHSQRQGGSRGQGGSGSSGGGEKRLPKNK